MTARGLFFKADSKVAQIQHTLLMPECGLRVHICSQIHNALSSQTLQSRKTVQVQNCHTKNQKKYMYIDRLHIKINIPLTQLAGAF